MPTRVKSKKCFPDWYHQLDLICTKLYLINTHDMGFDSDELEKFWQQNSTPAEMAEHFGTKYNLTLVEEVMLRG